MASPATTPSYPSYISSTPPPVLNEQQALQLESEVLFYTDRMFETATGDRDYEKEIRDTMRLLDYLDAKQWSSEARRARHRPVLPMTGRLFWDSVGMLTDLSLDFSVKMWSGSAQSDYSELQKILNELAIHWAMHNQYECRQYDVILYGLLHSGPSKIQWNPSLLGGMGDVQLLPIAPWQWAMLGGASDPQESECVIYYPVVTKNYLIRKFGETAKRVRCDLEYSPGSLQGQFKRPPNISKDSWARMGAGLRTMMGIKANPQADDTPFPMTMQKEFWFNDNCIVPSTRVLTTSLEWKRVDEVKVGDYLIGCDEHVKKSNRNGCRWLRRAKVESVKRVTRPSVAIITDRGIVECSKSHRWLSTQSRNEVYSWRFAGDIKPGDKIAFTFEPWETDKSWESGYLSGLFDGEGWVTKYSLGFGQSQKNNDVLRMGTELLSRKGFKFAVNLNSGVERRSNGPKPTSPLMHVQILGGRSGMLRFMGSIRPERLLNKSHILWEGKLLKNKGEVQAEVLAVEDVGDTELVSLQTDKRTFIAEGFVSHNSINETSATVTVGPHDSTGEPTVNWAYRVEPGEPLYPRGRVVVQAGGCVLEDQPSPYWDAKKPFPVFRPFRLPWKSSGYPIMRSWGQMNIMINKIMGGMQDYLHSVIEPTLTGPKGALPQADWDALDPGAAGGKIKYNNNAPKGVEFMKKAEFPLAAAFQYIEAIRREMDMSSGASATQQMMQKKQIPGADSIEMILNSRALPVKVESRSLANYIEEGGAMVLSRMLQFYTVAHRVNILGSKGITASDYTPVYGSVIPQGMQPEDFVRRFSGTVRRDTLLATEKERKQQIALGLYKLGVLSMENLWKILDTGLSWEENLKQMLGEARIKVLLAAVSAAAQGKGQKKK